MAFSRLIFERKAHAINRIMKHRCSGNTWIIQLLQCFFIRVWLFFQHLPAWLPRASLRCPPSNR